MCKDISKRITVPTPDKARMKNRAPASNYRRAVFGLYPIVSACIALKFLAGLISFAGADHGRPGNYPLIRDESHLD